MMHPEMREELAEQLKREHREGMAADRLEQERKRFDWDIEGWSSTDQLLLYIAGSGLHRIPADEVVRLANAMLAEHELRFRGETDVNAWVGHADPGYEERCRRAATRQGLDEPKTILEAAGIECWLEQTGGWVMVLAMHASIEDENDQFIWLTVDGSSSEPYLICRYREWDEVEVEDYAGPHNLVEKVKGLGA